MSATIQATNSSRPIRHSLWRIRVELSSAGRRPPSAGDRGRPRHSSPALQRVEQRHRVGYGPRMQTWKLLDERPGPAGYLTVRTRTYAMPDAREADWDVLSGGRTVAVLAMTADGDIVLTKQFRPGPAKILHELPGGLVDEHESVLDAAARELREETGYVADEMVLAGQTWLASYATHLRHAVLATGCRVAFEQRLDEDEFCEVVTMPMAHFLALLRSGDLTDADMAWMCLDRLHPWTPPNVSEYRPAG